MFDYYFLRNALIAGTIAAVLAGFVGYFMLIRKLAFAGHALGHIGFAGATGAGLVGLTPVMGQLFLTVFAAIGMGCLGHRVNKSDITIGVILALSLGLGVLFLHLYTQYAVQAMTILFGNLLGVSSHLINMMLIDSILSLCALSIIARPLLFSSLEPELAEAKGVSLSFISIVFMIIVAVAVTVTSQVVGVLLVFTLLIGPAASALNWTQRVASGLFLTVVLGVLMVWFGILLAFVTDWPIPFWISALTAFNYFLSFLGKKNRS
ncbi:ABC transporter permease [Rickettsiella grylli]|nr:ABC transporter permease [Rickettsiella grylli]